MARKPVWEAELSLLVLDASEPLAEEDLALLRELPENSAAVLNKTDLAECITAEDIVRERPGIPCVICSALEPESLEPVKNLIRRYTEVNDRLALTQPRHLEAISRAVGHLEDALKTAASETLDLAAVDLQAAQAALAEITGDQADEKLLDRIFEQFCVGK